MAIGPDGKVIKRRKLEIGEKVRFKGHYDKVLTIGYIVKVTEHDTLYEMEEDGGIRFWGNHLEPYIPTVNFIQEAPKKYNAGKPMMSLVRPEFTTAIAEVLTYGFEKYDEKRGDIQNYLKGDGFHYSEIYFQGVDLDPETSKSHLAHAGANLMFLLTYSLTEKGTDDRIVLEGVDIETETAEENSTKRSEGRYDTETKESDRSSENRDSET
jgi:hypothetical protein